MPLPAKTLQTSCANSFENVLKSIDDKSFQFKLNEIDADFGFASPIDFERGMKLLFHDYQFPATNQPQNL